MWVMTPEKVGCCARGDVPGNISYRCLTDSSVGHGKGRRQGQIGQAMSLKDWEPAGHSPEALIGASHQRKNNSLPDPI